MAIGRLSVGVGPKGKAGPHSSYIAREGKYAQHNDKIEKLEHVGSGNMPKWSESDPNFFWQMSDDKERKNGTSYREHVISLPRELTPDQRHDLIKDWIAQEIGDKHAYQYAIHNPLALDGGEQPHAHIMFSERLRDGIERDPDQYFKRFNANNPERGGAKKANTPKFADERKEELKAQRDRWETMCNSHLELAGSDARISMKSLADQGIEREPINLSMQQIKRADVKEIYADLLTVKASFKDAKLDSLAINVVDELTVIAINEKYYEQADRAIDAANAAINSYQQTRIDFDQYRDSTIERFSNRTADRDNRVSSTQQHINESKSAIERQQRLSAASYRTINSSKQRTGVTDQAIARTDTAIDARVAQQRSAAAQREQQRITESQQQQRIESRSAFDMLRLQFRIRVTEPNKYGDTLLKNTITTIDNKGLQDLLRTAEDKNYDIVISNKDDYRSLINYEIFGNDTAQAIESFMLRPEVLSNSTIMNDFGGKRMGIREFAEKYDIKCDFNDLKKLDKLNPPATSELTQQAKNELTPTQNNTHDNSPNF